MSRPEYSQWSHILVQSSTGSATPLNLAQAVGNYTSYAVLSPVTLNRISFLVTTLVTAGSVAGQVAFFRHPTYGSSASSVALGTLTIPNAATVGQVIYKDVYKSTANLQLNAGEEMTIYRLTQAVDSGNATGAGYVGFMFDPAPDADANQTNQVKSS